jgi:hypothetical protein
VLLPAWSVRSAAISAICAHAALICSLDCRSVGFVGDSGDVIDTTLRKTAMRLPSLANSRKAIEIDFEDGALVPIWAMNNRSSIGGSAPVVSTST